MEKKPLNEKDEIDQFTKSMKDVINAIEIMLCAADKIEDIDEYQCSYVYNSISEASITLFTLLHKVQESQLTRVITKLEKLEQERKFSNDKPSSH